MDYEKIVDLSYKDIEYLLNNIDWSFLDIRIFTENITIKISPRVNPIFTDKQIKFCDDDTEIIFKKDASSFWSNSLNLIKDDEINKEIYFIRLGYSCRIYINTKSDEILDVLKNMNNKSEIPKGRYIESKFDNKLYKIYYCDTSPKRLQPYIISQGILISESRCLWQVYSDILSDDKCILTYENSLICINIRNIKSTGTPFGDGYRTIATRENTSKSCRVRIINYRTGYANIPVIYSGKLKQIILDLGYGLKITLLDKFGEDFREILKSGEYAKEMLAELAAERAEAESFWESCSPEMIEGYDHMYERD